MPAAAKVGIRMASGRDGQRRAAAVLRGPDDSVRGDARIVASGKSVTLIRWLGQAFCRGCGRNRRPSCITPLNCLRHCELGVGFIRVPPMSSDKRQKRDLHAVNEDGMVLCNPRDKEAAHRAEMEGIATPDRAAVTCRKCLTLLYELKKTRQEGR